MKKIVAGLCAGAIVAAQVGIIASAYTLGDIDDDGEITVQDAYLTQVEYANVSAGNGSTFMDDQKSAGDVDGDDTITVQDAYLIQCYYAEASAGNSTSWESLIAKSDWRTAYTEFLESGAYLDYMSGDDVHFSTIYIDEDDIPELIYTWSGIHAAGACIAIFSHNKVVVLSGTSKYLGNTVYAFGGWGQICYLEGENLFDSWYCNFGVAYNDVYSISDGKAVREVYLTSDNYYPSIQKYLIDDVEVTEAEYNEKYAEYNISSMVWSPSYDDMYSINSTDIASYFNNL